MKQKQKGIFDMSSKRITDRSFFTCEAVELAEKLVGKIICNKIEDKTLRFRIIETEAYGKNDTACHSNKYKSGNGVTSQNMVGGTLYVHYNNKDKPGSMFDIVANVVGVGEGVLVRGGMNLDDPNEKYESKPMCLGEALRIDYKRLNRVDVTTSDLVWIEDDGFDCSEKIKKDKRKLGKATGIKQDDKDRLWRFSLQA